MTTRPAAYDRARRSRVESTALRDGTDRGLDNLRERHRGSVVTVGNYDGVHRGHQAMLARVAARARTRPAGDCGHLRAVPTRIFLRRLLRRPG